MGQARMSESILKIPSLLIAAGVNNMPIHQFFGVKSKKFAIFLECGIIFLC
jgi:hypothetical protein